jgi:hypothetical protein
MKRIFLLILLAQIFLFARAVGTDRGYAVNDTARYINSWKFYAGVTLQHVYLKTNNMPGVEAGFAFDNNLMLGVFGQGTIDKCFSESFAGNINVIHGEGGFMAGYVSEPDRCMRMGGLLKLGYVTLVADEEEIRLFKYFEPKAIDYGMICHPEIFGEIDITPYIRIHLGTGYSFHLLHGQSVLSEQSLNSWTMDLGLIFINKSN